MKLKNPPPKRPNELDLDVLGSGQLERILIDLLTVKYPGIEQMDMDRLFRALDVGDLEQVEQVEADMAQKSARWKLATLNLEA